MIDLDDLQTAVAGHERRPRHRGDAEAPNSNRIQSSSLDHKVDASAMTTPSKDENEPVLSCSADQRRQCMRDGIHRRTAGRQPTTKRMRGHIHATLLAFATLLSSVSCHMAEPAVQIAGGLREVSQAFHTSDTERPSLLEVCVGEAQSTTVFQEAGREVMRPRDALYGDDILCKATRDGILADVRTQRPKLVLMGWPCTLWSTLSNVNHRTPEERQRLRRLRQKEKPFLTLFRDLAREQLGRGDHIVGENPLYSAALDQDPILQVLERNEMHAVATDQCAHGLVAPDTGQPMKKPTCLLVSHAAFGDIMGRRCRGDHPHTLVAGRRRCRQAGAYTRLFGRRLLRALDAAEWHPDKQRLRRVHALHPSAAAGPSAGAKPDPLGERAIYFDIPAKAQIAKTLRRMHQNLAHPSKEDFVRNLRLSGASTEMLEAAKALKCASCARQQSTKAVEPGRLRPVGDFNAAVALDFIHVKDVAGKAYWCLSCVDLTTTYHVVGLVTSHKPAEIAQIFNDIWITPFGMPRQLNVDQDGAFRSNFTEAMEHYGAFVTATAGCAPWQHGRCERQGGWLKEIVRRTVEASSATGADEMRIVMSCCAQAKNTLRRKCGYSPAQWVFGAEPRMTADFMEEPENMAMLTTPSESIARRMQIRTEARAAFVRMQTCETLRRAALARTRPHRGNWTAGSYVYWWRLVNNSNRRGIWKGPGIVIGMQDTNVWVNTGGEAVLVAPEQSRLAEDEELWSPGLDEMTMHENLMDLQGKLDSGDADFEDDTGPGPEPRDLATARRDVDGHEDFSKPLKRRYRTKEAPRHPIDLPPAVESDEAIGDAEFKRRRQHFEPEPGEIDAEEEAAESLEHVASCAAHGSFWTVTCDAASEGWGHLWDAMDHLQEAFFTKRAVSSRAARKALEKEVPYSGIPKIDRAQYRSALKKQRDEFLMWEAVDVLSLAQSLEVARTQRREDIMDTRVLHRDKNSSIRSPENDVPLKAKARIIIPGHKDPELEYGVRTDAPTVSRLSTHIFFQLCATFNFIPMAADVEAAFLQGDELERQAGELYLRQPAEGFPGLEPGQLLRVRKAIFGLAVSPRLWWKKFSCALLKLKVTEENGEMLHFQQSLFDPALFTCHSSSGQLRSVVAVHVDDLLIAVKDETPRLKEAVLALFPYGEVKSANFEYCGKQVRAILDEGDRVKEIRIKQENFTLGRLDPIEIEAKAQRPVNAMGEPMATPAERHDNRSAVGGLGWIVAQTRPDVAFGTNEAQRHQNEPTLADIKQTNKLVELAKRTADHEQVIRAIAPSDLCMLVFHDAAWSNVESQEQLAEAAIIPEKPPEQKTARPKHRTQAGYLLDFAASKKEVGAGQVTCSSLLDWRSHTIPRVCTSTFAGETLAATESARPCLRGE